MENNETAPVDYTAIEIDMQERTRHRAQQTMSLIEPFITWLAPGKGRGREVKSTVWGGQTDLGIKSQRHQTYPQYETDRDAVFFSTVHFWAKEPIDGDDQLHDAADAQTGLSMVWGSAAARAKDKLTIRNSIGSTYRGTYGKTVAQRLPPSQIIPHGNTGLTEAKVRQAVGMIRRAYPEEVEPICLFLTGEQLTGDLMGEDRVSRSDYNPKPVLTDLKLPYYLGTYFRTIEDYAQHTKMGSANAVEFDPILPILPDGVSPGKHIRYCVMWVKSALRGRKDRELTVKIHDEEKDHGPGACSIAVDFMEGSARQDPLGVVVIECVDESPLKIAA